MEKGRQGQGPGKGGEANTPNQEETRYGDKLLQELLLMKGKAASRETEVKMQALRVLSAFVFCQAGDFLPRHSLARGSFCLLYTSPSPRDRTRSRMPSSA